MALLISFFAFSYFIVQMLETHKIINNTKINNIELTNNFLESHHSVLIQSHSFPNDELKPYLEFNLEASRTIEGATFHKSLGAHIHSFKLSPKRRGHYQIKRVRFFTKGKSQLFYVWRYFPIERDFYIYPEKKHTSLQSYTQVDSKRIGANEVEFHSHWPYNSGQNAKKIDWKVFARTDQLYLKKYVDQHRTSVEINFNNFKDDKELALSKMCYLITKCHKESRPWSLRLPNQKIRSSSGQRHYHKSLEAISEY